MQACKIPIDKQIRNIEQIIHETGKNIKTMGESFILLMIMKCKFGASLVAQRERIRPPMQETRIRSLVWEDPRCCRATKPMLHNY